MDTGINKFEYVSSSSKDFDLPTRGTKSSAGYDFHSPVSFVLKPMETIRISLEVKCRIKEGEFLMIVPRSSVGFKYNIRLWNTTGIIDSDYYNNPTNEGVINLKISNYGNEDYVVQKNDRIVQGIFVKYDVTSDDDVSEERVGGLGSTGK